MTNTRKILMGASALAGALAIALTASAASAETKAITFDLPSQPLGESLRDFYRESGEQIVFSEDLVAGRTSPALKGSYTADQALAMLLEGTNLSARRTSTGVVMIEAPQSSSAAGDGADGTVQALIVTAQKREEQIQDVPIAISAFTEKSLQEQKIEGGFDLLKAIPNVTFSKNNFTSYNFSIRGIGTKAVSATTDPAVAVSFNNTPVLQNRLFEQEYFDVERVEVLRGPQGTLYGRNATAGVINVISAKPKLHEFEAMLKGEVGNYSAKRLSGMVNVPIVTDKLGIRLAGAWTKRDGYDFNLITGNPINGRDLWSARLTIGFQPAENFRSNFIWERFEEDDDRSRTGKQLCHRDLGPEVIGGRSIYSPKVSTTSDGAILRRATFSQGCKPGSLYDDGAFDTPNGLALPFVFGMLALQAPGTGSYGHNPDGSTATLLRVADPYGGRSQSHDLREIESIIDPTYRAKANLYELNIDWDLTSNLTFSSQTLYNDDQVYSSQDFNRFNTEPVFNDTSVVLNNNGSPSPWQNLAPRPEGSPLGTPGVFCDPQLGCSDRIVGFDISQAKARQFSQEFRLQSSFDGPINFSAGVNYTKFDALVDYYVFYNLISAFALSWPFYFATGSAPVDMTVCPSTGIASPIHNPVPQGDPNAYCPYIDPNPLESINGEGHNYFRSKNPYKLKSAAAFGELYWELNDELKLTAGLRYTGDKKRFIQVPSQVLLGQGLLHAGMVNKGYPEAGVIKQEWREWSGRLGVDWKPDLPFTDRSLIYAFYSRGYKGGGANPPSPGFADIDYTVRRLKEFGLPDSFIQAQIDAGNYPFVRLTGVEYGPTFEPEFVDAFEIGSKNTLLGGAMTFNTTAFYYDYKDYQVSQIRDRTAVNENFDATNWGLEFETTFAPSRNLQIIANLGYLDTKIADGETSIDIMNRTQGNEDFVLVKPWVQAPSNCIVPMHIFHKWLDQFGSTLNSYPAAWYMICGNGGNLLNSAPIIDSETGKRYDPLYYNGQNGTIDINGGAGIAQELGGNELPNAPHWTMNIGAQYAFETDAWRLTFRGDAYWQSQSWARVYNSNPYDKLHGWYNLNLSAWLEIPAQDLKVEFYVKNILDKTPITDAFLNSDDTALTTNVFVLDPRLIGLSVRKGF